MGRYIDTIKIQKKRGYEGGLSYVYKTNVKSWCVDSFYLYCVQYMTSGSYKFLFQRKIFCSLGQLVVLILSICIVYSI